MRAAIVIGLTTAARIINPAGTIPEGTVTFMTVFTVCLFVMDVADWLVPTFKNQP
jgi:hypothetical protein